MEVKMEKKKSEYVKWFESKIVPMLKKHRFMEKCDCQTDDTGNTYQCPYHFVEGIILREIGNHVDTLDAENARLKRNTDADFEPELEKLKKLEKNLTLIRDDFAGYGKFVDRNIKQSKQLVDVGRIIEKERDNLYESLPTGDVDAFILIKVIKEHIKELDKVIERLK